MPTTNTDTFTYFDALDLTDSAKKAAAEEAAKFLTSFSINSEARQQYTQDPKSVLSKAGLSAAAQEIILAPNSNLLLRELQQNPAAVLAVIVLETVTTEVVVL